MENGFYVTDYILFLTFLLQSILISMLAVSSTIRIHERQLADRDLTQGSVVLATVAPVCVCVCECVCVFVCVYAYLRVLIPLRYATYLFGHSMVRICM
jgi:hypothetical protein